MTIIPYRRQEVVFLRRNSNHRGIKRVPIVRYGHHIIMMTAAAAAAAPAPLAMVVIMMGMTMIKTTNIIIIIIMVAAAAMAAAAVALAAADIDIGQANINIGIMITIKDNFMVAIVIHMDDIVVMHQFTIIVHQRLM